MRIKEWGYSLIRANLNDMENVLEQIAFCVESGKINQDTPYPPALKGKPGANEYTLQALDSGVPPSDILSSLIKGMEQIGIKFRENKVFIPQVLMSAKAMNESMKHLRKYFVDGSVRRKGVLILGTVEGDLHDIGKNLVAMIAEGNGYEIVDLGVDVSAEKFLAAIAKHPDAFIGMSALLTTTMLNMEKINKEIKKASPQTLTFVGGAPLNAEFAKRIGADYYTDKPQDLVEILNGLIA